MLDLKQTTSIVDIKEQGLDDSIEVIDGYNYFRFLY